jgi:enoyl-CoA hydratase/carnithine racemase
MRITASADFAGLQELPGLNKPVIAAVNGMAVGGGFELALSADMILAAEHARFSLPEIKAGTLADAATLKLPRRMPFHIAMELLLTGRWMEAAEAARWGLVNEIVPAAEVAAPRPSVGANPGRWAAAGIRRDQGSGAGSPKPARSMRPSRASCGAAFRP